MRSLLRWAPPALLAAWVVSTPEARAYNGHGRAETVYVAPTETVLSVPTSYVSSTSYALPTSYISPTVYTSSYVPTTYYLSPTAYVVPSYRTTGFLRPRRVVERPVYTTTRYYDVTPTTYYYTPTVYSPTVVDYPVATSYESPCETTVSAPTATTAPSVSSSVQQAPKASAPTSTPPAASAAPRRSPPPVVSEPKEEPPLRTEPKPSSDDDLLPPPQPAPEKPEDSPPPPAVPSEIPNPGLAPLGPEIPPAPQTRESFRPVMPSSGILDGKVVSGTSGQAVRDVRVIVSHRLRPRVFTDREAKTDALGRFAIEVPSGDWEVKATRSDGKTFSVRNITVSGGQITSDEGQAVPSLIINL